MAKKRDTQQPSYRRQKKPNGADLAFVVIGGRRRYLGKYGTKASRQAYHRLVAEVEASGGLAPVAAGDITVVEVCRAYMRHARAYYRGADGRPTSSMHVQRMALRPLRRLYGRTKAVEFGPLALKAVRREMVEAGWCRHTVNQGASIIRGMFRWAASEQLVPADVYAALATVAGLRRGRCDARESEAVRPVPPAHIEAIREHVSPVVWRLVQSQLHTGARAGELVKLRPIDIDTTGTVWTARLDQHKTSHRGRSRVVYIGPRAKAVLREAMADRPLDAYLFSPRESHAARRASGASVQRRPGQKPSPRKTARRMREHFDTAGYRRAITRACKLAGVPAWTPHRLRHTAATIFRKESGLEAAQLLLGHARADVTQLYAEANEAKAIAAARKVG